MPFEVSHWYHLYHGGEQDGRYIFWVSSATEVLGYLPYETQLRYGGYEVNGSSRYMGRLHPFYLSSSEISKLFEEFTKFE